MNKNLLLSIIVFWGLSIAVFAEETTIPCNEYGHILLSDYENFDDTDIVSIVLSNDGEHPSGWGIGKIIPINEWSHEGHYQFAVKVDPATGLENTYEFTIAQLKDFAKIDGEYHVDSYGLSGITLNLWNLATTVGVFVETAGNGDGEKVIPHDEWGHILLKDYENYNDEDDVTITLSNAGEKSTGWGIGKIIPINEWGHAGYYSFAVNVDPTVSLDNKYKFKVSQLKEFAKIDGEYHVDENGSKGITINVYNDAVIVSVMVKPAGAPSGFVDVKETNSVHIANNILYFEKATDVQIIDMSGRVCNRSFSVSSLDISFLKNGVYIAVLDTKGDKQVVKFIR